MPAVQLPDAVIHYETSGGGDAVLFLHGVGSTCRTWSDQLDYFGRARLAIAADMRGYGSSRCRPETVSMRQFAIDMASLIERLGAGRAHICGLSMGGVVALNLWRERPDLVRSLVLADSWANHPSATASHPQRLAGIDSATMPELARARMPAVYGAGASDELVERGVRAFATLDKSVYRAASADLWPQDLRDVARSVSVPTLVLVGEEDTVTPPVLSEELADLIAGARLVRIPAAGHLTNEENPAAFNAALEGHLRDAP